MKAKIVADGSFRFWQAKKKATAVEPIDVKYAAQLAKANPDEKRKLQERITAEKIIRERTLAHEPSAGTLW
jgi:hypothetical protein